MGRLRSLPVGFFQRAAEEVARDLLGRDLVRRLGDRELVLRIVETEAYLGIDDRASHAWRGRRTERNRVLFDDGGIAYVYFIYGKYYCLNAVTGRVGDGSAVLIRAGEPLSGEPVMRRQRGLKRSPRPGDLAGGPGKLCQALAIDRRFNARPLDRGPLRITTGVPVVSPDIAAGSRVGVGYAGRAAGWPLRFAVRDNPHVSRPPPW